MAGIPLVNVDGWLVAILDPDPRRIGREQFALHAGTLLLFTTEDRQARFARDMQDYEPKPLGGWKDRLCSQVGGAGFLARGEGTAAAHGHPGRGRRGRKPPDVSVGRVVNADMSYSRCNVPV